MAHERKNPPDLELPPLPRPVDPPEFRRPMPRRYDDDDPAEFQDAR